ncbi:flagellar protein export ATPase FliI [Terribacillus saccharophilus]|uniref:Flagellar protein export ATPase FliI n=1 Tax=Terribacillus saccharophilus TaxID=361277 RepID=A0A268HCV0_9BACI|nr:MULTISPECIES: flagellar protein export ATPase FliI [Terribacillus]PAD37005.1 flagellar protein export ATPase FliI [Terribacillus saccharophilus]PAD97481.1 flagellar protein export ATPase FliI [Terribacillus saccharophilus]PAE01530.1 flagellar protein export ATPase FliI [Terribacillus saccharophilus]PAE07712.1 flagellar protein export ATPase FliI [Terribacillus saccharophilus]
MLGRYIDELDNLDTYKRYGRIHRVVGLLIESHGPVTSVGEVCYIHPSSSSGERFLAEVVGFDDEKVLLMPFAPLKDVGPGCLVEATSSPLSVKIGHGLIGSIIDPLGQPLDGSMLPKGLKSFTTDRNPPNPMTRPRILEPLETGVRVIDSLLTVGQGQRVGIFAGSGVGKSTLLGMIARKSSADVNVIALIGERGREVREFIEKDLGEEGIKRSIIVVATSDQPALMRIKGAYTATAICEYFRDQGMHVNLMMDSVTRVAMAQREIGLASGEPPTTKGYTPSVFAALPKLLERTGTNELGAITAFYTVLVDGDDMNEPIADTVRGILDGHFVLDRKLAEQGQFPALNVLKSISRVMPQITDEEVYQLAQRLRTMLALYEENRELIQIGAYKRGTNNEIDEAIGYQKQILDFLKQGMHEFTSRPDAIQLMKQLLGKG